MGSDRALQENQQRGDLSEMLRGSGGDRYPGGELIRRPPEVMIPGGNMPDPRLPPPIDGAVRGGGAPLGSIVGIGGSVDRELGPGRMADEEGYLAPMLAPAAKPRTITRSGGATTPGYMGAKSKKKKAKPVSGTVTKSPGNTIGQGMKLPGGGNVDQGGVPGGNVGSLGQAVISPRNTPIRGQGGLQREQEPYQNNQIRMY